MRAPAQTMVLPFLLLATPAWAAPPKDLPIPPPPWFAARVGRAEKAMASVESGRWLRGVTADVGVEPRNVDPAGPPVQFLPGDAPVIGVDAIRSPDLTDLEFELALARARARAAFAAGFGLVEAEQAAEQAVAAYAVERAQELGSFGERLKRPLRKLRDTPESEPLPDLARRDPEREAQLLARFAREPEDFYWTVEHDRALPAKMVRLPELEAFLRAYTDELDAAACPPPGRYCRLAGLLARPELVEAARAVKGSGGLERLREKLGPFQREKARELQARIREWLRII